MSSRLRSFGRLAVFLSLAFVVISPNLTGAWPGRDSGVFLYIGSEVRQGRLPYLDTWDHKPPLIYYVNAMATAITPRSEIGIWVLEGTSLVVAGWLLYRLVQRRLGTLPALASTGLLFGGLALLLRPGNFTEEFALPVSILAISLYSDSGGRPGPLRSVILGLLFGAAILLRPNNAGTGVAILISLILLRQPASPWKARLGSVAVMSFTAALLVALGIGYFWWRGAGPALWDAVVRFNAIYVRAGLEQRLDAVLEGVASLAPTGLPLFAAGGWAIAALAARARATGPTPDLYLVAVLAFPMELLLAALAGQGLLHYYINWLPVLCLLTGIFFSRLTAGEEGKDSRGPSERVLLASGLLVMGLLYPARRVLPNAFHLVTSGPRDTASLAGEVAAFGESGRELLVWGAEVSYNYITGRASPSRYAYQYPLYVCEYTSPERVATLAKEIRTRRPMIIDTSSTNDRVPSLDPDRRRQQPYLDEECGLSPPMEELMGWIDAHYTPAGILPTTGWTVYLPTE
jgi:hypothetical protein